MSVFPSSSLDKTNYNTIEWKERFLEKMAVKTLSNFDLSDDKIMKAKYLILKYIKNEISFEDACREALNAIGIDAMIKEIYCILNVGTAFKQDSPILETVSKSKKLKMRNWDKYTDYKLLRGIYLYGTDWLKVSQFVGSKKSKTDCQLRYERSLNPNISFEKWTKEEDTALSNLVKKYGMKSWYQISKEICTRSDVQCKYRYKQITTKTKWKNRNARMATLDFSRNAAKVSECFSFPENISNLFDDNLFEAADFSSLTASEL